jgi:chemotaxis protein methyltransferase CheR
MTAPMLEQSLTPQLFAILTGLIEERVGMSYSLAEKDIFALKVAGRALEAGFDSLLDYYYYLRYDAGSAAEFDALVDVLVVNETFFFRELEPLRVLVSDKLVPTVQSQGRARVWCAACSSGEEPLTLAMLLAEQGVLDRVEIIASDLCPRVLARAQSGRYGAATLRRAPMPSFARRWVQADEQGGAISMELVRAITWRQINLVDTPAVSSLGAMDVILCRNVLIYFRDAVALRVVKSMAELLTPGGLLCVGVSESLIRFDTGLTCEERHGSFFYRKAGP